MNRLLAVSAGLPLIRRQCVKFFTGWLHRHGHSQPPQLGRHVPLHRVAEQVRDQKKPLLVGVVIAHKDAGLIINTGSKQGITTPPGDPAYNVSKAGVKAFTEALQHELRNTPDCNVTAHLLIPGFVFTGLTANGRTAKPAGAWTPEETVEFMLESLVRGDFYILCPDNDVNRALDEKRIAWAAGDGVSRAK